VSRYGNHFEKEAILAWFNNGNTTCPVTGKPLRPSNLVPDHTLKWKIGFWRSKNCQTDTKESVLSTEEPIAFVTIAPDEHFCPLTHKVMDDPVMTRDGKTFERKAIMKWFDEEGYICPISGNTLKPSGLISNCKLKREIDNWQLTSPGTKHKLKAKKRLSKAKMLSRHSLSEVLSSLRLDADQSSSEVDIQHVDNSKSNFLDLLDDTIDTLEYYA